MFLAAIGAATLLAAGCSAAFASSSPAPVHGHIYWTNGHWIGRARLSGTGVNQRFIITRPSTRQIGLFGAAVAPGR